MIKALQRKFIRIAMLAATLLMVVFLLAINISNLWTTNREMTRTLKIIVANSASARPDFAGFPAGNAGISEQTGPSSSSDDTAPAGPADAGNETQAGINDLLNSERYFFVRVTEDGQVIYSDLTHISSVDEAKARELCGRAEATGKTGGHVAGFIFLKSVSETTGGAVYAFIDDQEEIGAVLRMVVITAVIGAVCWLIALVLVIRLSGRAIRPIAENMERQKQFVTNAGHEIRTPLAIIRANADVLALHQGENKWIDNIRNQTDRLSALTKNLLTLARADEDGNEGLPASSFDPGVLFRETAESFAHRAETRHVTFTVKAEPGKSFRFSRTGFEQLVSILADNAVTYVDEGEGGMPPVLKAISVLLFKSEGQAIRRHPEWHMGRRLLLDKMDLAAGTVRVGDADYPLRTTDFPTVDLAPGGDAYAYTAEEARVMDGLVAAFTGSERLRAQIQWLYDNGGVYRVVPGRAGRGGYLLVHGCVPLAEDGTLAQVDCGDRTRAGRELLDWTDAVCRRAWESRAQADLDWMGFFWTGWQSTFMGRVVKTFERTYLTDTTTWAEPEDPYYALTNDDPAACGVVLRAFGCDPERDVIVNGHTPVKLPKGQRPVRGGGRRYVIDGGFCRAYRKSTGIAGYTLIDDDEGVRLVTHGEFAGLDAALDDHADVTHESERLA